MPEDIGGSPGRFVRISLGAMTAKDVRLRAELLAALARERFAEIRSKRMTKASEDSAEIGWTMFDGETPEIGAAAVKAYLKAMQAVHSPPAEPPPHQMPALAGIRVLVLLNRKLDRGADANPLIVENAEGLRHQAVSRIEATIASVEAARSAIPAVRTAALEPWAKVTGGAPEIGNRPAPSIDGQADAASPASPPIISPAGAQVRVHRDANGKIIPAFCFGMRLTCH